MSKLYRISVLGLLLVFALVLVACGGAGQQAAPTEAPVAAPTEEAQPEPTEAPAEEAVPTPAPVTGEGSIAVLLPDSASSARWEADDRRYFDECFTAAGVDYTIVNAEGDARTQQTQAEQAITNGAKVLLLVNLDSGSGAAIIAQAREAGAKVIDYDRLTIEGPGADVYVSFDNVAVGRLMGETLEPVIDGLGLEQPQVVQLNGSPTDNNATLFREGYNSIVQPRVDAGDWALVADQAVPDWDNQQALVIFEQILTAAGGNVDAVFAANDGLASSVIAALKGQGLDPVPLSGQDATVTGMQYVLSGDQTMSVYKPIKLEADAACAAAIALLNGDDVTTLTSDTLNNGTNDVPFIKLTPLAVTRENMADTVIADGFRTWEEICVGEFLQYCPEGSVDGAGGMAPMTAAVAGGAAAGGETTGEMMAMVPGGFLEQAYNGDFSGTTVTVDGPFTDEDAVKFEQSIAAFEEATGIDINYIGSKEFEGTIGIRVDAGDAPDIADFPQPGLLATFVSQGKVVDPTAFLPQEWLDQQYNPSWLQMAQMEGPDGEQTAGVWHRFNGKSLVWYPKDDFEAAGYEIPETWDELMALTEQIAADGDPAWCIGIESGAATGWPATDWTEELMLRTTSLENYDAWVDGTLPFSSPEVKNAIETFSEIWFNPDYVFGGTNGIVSTFFGDSPTPMFTDPPGCWLHKQGNFITGFFPPEAQAGVDYDFFYLPPVDEAYGKPFLVAGDIMAMFNDRPEVRAVMEFFTLPESAGGWLATGGALAAHQTATPDMYGQDMERGIAELVSQATSFRFDGSDLMPGEVGAGSFWKGMTDYVSGAATLDQVLSEIDASWPR